MGHPRGCTAVPEAHLRKAFSALLKSPEQGALLCSQHRDTGCELEQSEFCPIHGPVQELLHLRDGPAAGLTHLPGAQEAACQKQGDATCERAVREEDVENGTCSSEGTVREPLDPQGTSATGHVLKNLLRRFLGQRSSRHPVLTSLLLLLLFLLLAVVAALAVRSAQQVPAPPAAPTLVLGCPSGWFGYNGVCYYFSRDSRTWEQSQERCSELGASLAIVQDEAMHWLLRLRGNVDYWLGLRRRGERLRWGDGSSFSSSVPVLGSEECVCLAEEKFRSESCSNPRPYLCSKAQAPL
ncbi:C-type lectin domain family 2 member D-like [Cinclus cinclus]|uniref:C-type lectin domain family 2 member D-like n=1 Tax=Cinclus cinclus TaxID=127875 RepID=UPI002E0E1DDB